MPPTLCLPSPSMSYMNNLLITPVFLFSTPSPHLLLPDLSLFILFSYCLHPPDVISVKSHSSLLYFISKTQATPHLHLLPFLYSIITSPFTHTAPSPPMSCLHLSPHSLLRFILVMYIGKDTP